MQSLIRGFLVFLCCVGLAAGVVIWLLDLAPAARRRTDRPDRMRRACSAEHTDQDTPGPTAVSERPNVFDIVLETFEDGGYKVANRHMAPIRDLGSL
jgi:hypothetical protein